MASFFSKVGRVARNIGQGVTKVARNIGQGVVKAGRALDSASEWVADKAVPMAGKVLAGAGAMLPIVGSTAESLGAPPVVNDILSKAGNWVEKGGDYLQKIDSANRKLNKGAHEAIDAAKTGYNNYQPTTVGLK